MKTKTSILKCLLLFLIFSCSNNDEDSFTPTLPPITQTGANTFGCYIDGKLLTPRDGTGTFNSPDYGVLFVAGPGPTVFSYHELRIRDFKSGNKGLIDIHILDLLENGEGIYPINEGNCQDNVDANQNNNIRCRWYDSNSRTEKWFCSVANGGTINITRYDLVNKIISGTFSCTVKNLDDPNDIIEITEGRFDIKWDLTSNYP